LLNLVGRITYLVHWIK